MAPIGEANVEAILIYPFLKGHHFVPLITARSHPSILLERLRW